MATTTSSTTTYCKGDKVMGLGRMGRTWRNKPVGTVTALPDGWVRVQWDNCAVEDDMSPADLLPVYWADNLCRFVTCPATSVLI